MGWINRALRKVTGRTMWSELQVYGCKSVKLQISNCRFDAASGKIEVTLETRGIE